MNNIDVLTIETTNFVNSLLKDKILPKIVKYVNERESITPLHSNELVEYLLLPNLKTTTHIKHNSNKLCIWEFKRGKYRGDSCGKPTIDGSDYCSSCSKRLFLKKQHNQNNSNISNIVLNDILISDDSSTKLDVIPIKGKLNVFRDENNYVMRVDKSNDSDVGVMYVIGKFNNENQEIIPLTEQEIEDAENEGYLVDELKDVRIAN